jgi:hypothetical protein
MVTPRRKAFATCALLALVPFLCAPQAAPPAADGPAHRVPYRLSETLHIVVRAKLNGKGPFNFIVDTGAPAMFVTTDVAKQVGVDAARGWVTFDVMEIEGGAKLKNAGARVEDIFQIRGMNGMNLPGVRLDGVVGYNILAKFRMEFDLSKSWMTWTELNFDPPPPVPLMGEGGASAPPELQALGAFIAGFGGAMGRGKPEPLKPRGFIGVELADEEGETVAIKFVLPESPAEAAGLKPGDVVTEIGGFGGKPVRSAADVLKATAAIGVGDEVKFVVKRGDDKHEVAVKAGKGF